MVTNQNVLQKLQRFYEKLCGSLLDGPRQSRALHPVRLAITRASLLGYEPDRSPCTALCRSGSLNRCVERIIFRLADQENNKQKP